ncbi:hypothetical protein Trihar35433_8857 [Trichoderma harzianum]|nr:hypothetical protein Trihar35433_8857 [Trichoderma harzianum]
MTANSSRSHTDYNVGWVCARLEEQTAAIGMLDEVHESLSKPPNDTNAYTLGSIGQHNIVIACLPKGYTGPNSAATVAIQMVQTFSSIRIGLLVGIGGGIPPKVRLGDVVVSTPDGQFPGVVQWDLGKSMEGGKFERTDSLNNPPNSLLSALGKLESKHELEGSRIPDFLAQFGEKYPLAAKTYLDPTPLRDVLFKSGYLHIHKNPIEDNGVSSQEEDEDEDKDKEGCVSCDPSQIVRRKQRSMRVHYGLIASSNTTIEDAELRDRIHKELGKKLLCVETEGAGLMNSFPCIVIRGICDYADSHKNKTWQKYAAAVAAAFAKELLGCVQSSDVEGERPIRDILNEVKDELHQISRHIKAGFGETKKGLDDLIRDQKLQKENEALVWLSSIDFASMHHDYIKKCEPGTGQDLLNSEELQQWINIPRTTLFCPGIPGAGKTFQTAILIDYLSREFRHDDTIGLAFFYYRFDRQDAQKPEQLIANLIKQLGQNHKPSREKIQRFYEGHKEEGKRPLIKELTSLLRDITSLLSRAYVIIDALDERMAQLPDFVQGNIPLQEEIKESIESAIEGMFLLAQMYIDSLVGKRSIASVRRALEGLKTYPKESKDRSDVLSKAYHKAMERIQQQKGDLPADAMTILAWVVKSRKPLPLGTLRLILAIDTEKCMIDQDNFPTADHITQAYAPLVVIESKTQTARLAHYTIQEYFERSNNTWMEKSQQLIANTCMSYLSFSTIRSVFKNENDHEGNFHNYATEFWAHHTEAALLVQGLEVPTVEFFLHSSINSDLWHDSLMQIDLARTNLSADKLEDLLQISEQVVELHVAACLGLSGIVIELINKGCDPDVRDKRNRSPLWWAAYSGHAGIVEFLLKQKVNIEVKDTFFYATPLKLAAKRGALSIVRLLLDKDADLEPGNRNETGNPVTIPEEVCSTLTSVDKMFQPYGTDAFDIYNQDWWCLSPLALAAKKGYEEVSALLLRRGAKTESKSDYGPEMSPLHAAIWAGREIIVKLLLTHGADVEMRDEEGSTALHIASTSNQTSMIEILLSNGADIKSQGEDGYTALHFAASIDGKLSTLNVLLVHGADVDIQDDSGSTALHNAASFNLDDVAAQLLAHGASVDIRNGEGQTALHIAVECYDSTVFEILLAYGADVNIRDNEGQTALHIVARSNYRYNFIEQLLAHGADVNIPDTGGRTALRITAKSDYGVVEQLLAHGADVNIQDNDGCTALHIAAKSDYGVVEQLLAHGADVNIQDNDGCTALHIAAGSSYGVVEQLFAHGADVNIRGNKASTTLHIMAKSGDMRLAAVLLEQGAHIDAKNEQGETALMIASRHGFQEIVDLLIAQGAKYSEQSILSCAIISRLWPTVERLKAKGITIDEDAAVCGGRMLISVIDKGDLSLLNWLLQYNVDVNYCDWDRGNPLHRAVETGNLAIISRLLKVEGIHIEKELRRTRFNPLESALRRRNREIVKLLITAGYGGPEALRFLEGPFPSGRNMF